MIRVIVFLLAILLFTACDQHKFSTAFQATEILEIKTTPSDYYDKDILIKGEVIDSTKVFNFKLFKLKDNSGEIWVITNKHIPKEGQYVSMIVTLDVIASFKDDAFGIHVTEKKRL